MILYAEDDKIITPQKILLTDDIQQNVVPSRKIILPEDIEEQDEYTRREFMMFSLACMGMLAIPSRSNAHPGLAIAAEVAGGLYSIFKFVKHSARLIKIYKRWRRYRGLGKVNIPEIKVPRYYKSKAHEIAEGMKDVLGLVVSANGIRKALNHLSESPEFWDRRGYAQNTKGDVYMNRTVVYLENKTNNSIERKVRLILVNSYGRTEYSKQFTMVANPHDSGTFNLSEYFRYLPKTGMKTFKYDVDRNYKDVQVRSTNKKISISTIIV